MISNNKFKIISKNLITASYEKSSLNFGEIVNYFNQNNIKIEDIATDDDPFFLAFVFKYFPNSLINSLEV